MSIKIKYSCQKCGINMAELSVPERRVDESVVFWVQSLGKYVQKDHIQRSSACHCEFVDLMIPITDDQTISSPTLH